MISFLICFVTYINYFRLISLVFYERKKLNFTAFVQKFISRHLWRCVIDTYALLIGVTTVFPLYMYDKKKLAQCIVVAFKYTVGN